jgi:hypothetical protein
MTIRILKQFIYLRTGGSIYITKERIISLFFELHIHRRHSQRTHTHPYEYTHANPTNEHLRRLCRYHRRLAIDGNVNVAYH